MKTDPFWWEAAPRPEIAPPDLPLQADIVIIGSGYTGLIAALKLTEAGCHVVVLEAGQIGSGASSRNSGFVGRTLKYSFGDLVKAKGLDHAIATYREMQTAFEAVALTVAEYRIDCGFKQHGRLVLAETAAQFEDLKREYELRHKHLGAPFEVLDRPALTGEIGSDRYVGGVILPDLGSIHPGLYHQGLVAAAQKLGIALHPLTRASSIRRGAGGFAVKTSRGDIAARDVILATNGYTDGLVPWLQRRLIPFDAWKVATEELPPGLIDQLLPKDRTYIDSYMNIDAIRRSPDGRRILYCGKTGQRSNQQMMARRLLGELQAIFPALGDVELTHSWTGRCAASFDLLPHIGTHEGMHYAVGYCFAGLPMGSHFGRLLAQRILAPGTAPSVFADQPFPTVPLYGGNNWFVPWMMRWYDFKEGKKHAA
ncbi:glycine/D-amino acid oxidase-like deaminating enzyme [Dongia mobilis]|uniref:Glycine/D-amino acid oxidase-like deaminating enzyme n=1 Tax=Dongia mobilis TaxID=578943 RepID=A0A4R6WW47_9PROT|nr:FAD-binding oxidoreductase [Dongia mobilis]TDQ84264.1 glycine/D-amino acid oxidase-like deaminating enzyme [Dongia mobilis]